MFELNVKTRDEKVNAATLRAQGLIPAEVYGHNRKNIHVAISKVIFEKLFNQAGESNLISLTIDSNKSFNVLIKGIQLDSVNDQVLHADLYIVKMDEKLTTEIPLVFVGTARAVKELGGILVKSMSQVPVECLPKDLVSEIKIDISSLSDFGTVIAIGDIKWPSGIEVKVDPEVPICLVQEPRVEKEPEPVAPVEGEEPKSPDEGKEPENIETETK
jgi:large subunit ribosomal protein L25